MKRTKLLAFAFAAAATFALAPQAHAADKKLERTWKAKCSSCHGLDGKAETKKGKEIGIESMATADFQKKYSDADIKKAILDGVKKNEDGKKKEMDPFKDELKPEQVDQLVQFVRAFAPAK